MVSGDPLCWPRNTLHPQNLALTSSKHGSRSAGIVHSQTKATGIVLVPLIIGPNVNLSLITIILLIYTNTSLLAKLLKSMDTVGFEVFTTVVTKSTIFWDTSQQKFRRNMLPPFSGSKSKLSNSLSEWPLKRLRICGSSCYPAILSYFNLYINCIHLIKLLSLYDYKVDK
jgi:hypothetical protein